MSPPGTLGATRLITAWTCSARLKEIDAMDRTVLPIPDKPYAGPVYEDAKDPRAVYEPIRPVRPPAGAPNVLVILLDDVGFGAASVFGGPCRTPDGRAAGRQWPVVLPVPHDGAVRADPAGAADGPQPSRGRDGGDHRDRHVDPGLHLGAAAVGGTPGGGAAAQRVRDRAVRQVPRGPGVADQPGRARSMRGPRAAAASSTSSASSAVRPTSTRPRCTAARPRSSPTALPTRSTTSPRT